ncbi:MAG: bifunctional diguanylate cyclase/phosphodiesterase, partial [Spirochaetales bacterium]|nr:bifunctional diguanylate cyclase/phosphodiesterase [Spirochaetales bacterium]
ADRLKNNIRYNDLVARLGGDEFVIIMSHIKDEISPVVLANKLRSVVKESITIGDTKHYLSLSIGIANFPTDGTYTDELLKKADFVMYQAKNAGKDCYKYFSQEQDRKLHRKLQIETNLRKGLSNNEFRIVMQPKTNTMTGELSGVEALLRWNNSQLGKIGPDVFIPIAEECGIIHSLGLWAFRESIRIYKELNIVSSHSFLLSVNLSPTQLQDRNFVSKIFEIVEEAKIDTDNIEFEITEGLLLKNDPDIYNTLNRLTSLGFHLAIDGFGTGYSSLSYLKRFKVNTLKIDKSFIQNMLKDNDYLEIVKVIISMAKIFGMTTVAEGVEENDELVSLKNLGCDQIQGYYYSKPLEYQDILNYITVNMPAAQNEQVQILTG